MGAFAVLLASPTLCPTSACLAAFTALGCLLWPLSSSSLRLCFDSAGPLTHLPDAAHASRFCRTLSWWLHAPSGLSVLCVHCSHSAGSPRVREPSGPGSCPALPSSVAPVVSAAPLSSLERSKPSTSVCGTKLSCLCSRQLRNAHYTALKFSVNFSVA